ncbi:hypothetical protein AB4027_11005 [Alkalibacterium putridalgicola]|uniref:Uncharacterized protein n=1 Tax=Alkalibacterium putridalgicola TaxID=426703 RepID=A0A1H7UD99_9LACT|nr:hypothetical protein [Alkalibacterium putridalgicola]GEK90340.1 hypothetical protein APU01nite_23790 [Alkalibacterium putridalgicola]SEL94766.1 hypothetical protein SAMN04488100_1171 [Alkalibacterium putridalgicola]
MTNLWFSVFPLIMMLFSLLIAGVFIYALLSLAQSNRQQAESLREIERTLKRMTNVKD